MPVQPTHDDNIVLGAGLIYFDKFDANGNKTGERYLGQTPGFSVTATSEKLEKYTSDGPIAELMVSVTTRIERTGTLVCDDMSMENFSLFIAGEASDLEQAANVGVTEDINVFAGLSYQLGGQVGVQDVTDVSAEIKSGSTPLVLGTDYTLDAALGRITMLEGTLVPASSNPLEITVTYTTGVKTIQTIQTTDQVSQRGALRFLGDNTVGENRNVYMPMVELSPDGEIAFKSRDDFQQIQFSLSVQAPEVGEAIMIYGS